MAFELKPTHFYLGVWRAMLADDNGDFMAMVWKDEADGLWHLKLRFRYYQDDKYFESKDERSWAEYKSKTGEREEGLKMKDLVDYMLQQGAILGFGVHNISFIPCNGDGEAMAKILTNPERPGVQWAVMTEDQNAEYQRTRKLPNGITLRGDGT
jgi:hypothetical protein